MDLDFRQARSKGEINLSKTQFSSKLSPMVKHQEQFASDNSSGMCPEVLEAMLLANEGDVPSYGDDVWTEQVSDRFRELFERDCEVFFVFNGTGANSLALASLCRSFHSIIVHETSHAETDECGAPEYASNGCKLLLGNGGMGKLSPESVHHLVTKRTDLHYPKPKAISLTQSTEMGTLYKPDELANIHEVARKHNLYIHMDGARFANACAALETSPADLSWRNGIDVLCFGGSKNGMALGEAVIFFNKRLAEDFEYRCKQASQLASKMRFISAPWLGLLENDIWLKNAAHANKCAHELAAGLDKIKGIDLLFPVEANAVFVEMPVKVQEALRAKGWRFYTFIGEGGVRLMCSWCTTISRIEDFISDTKEAVMNEVN